MRDATRSAAGDQPVVLNMDLQLETWKFTNLELVKLCARSTHAATLRFPTLFCGLLGLLWSYNVTSFMSAYFTLKLERTKIK